MDCSMPGPPSLTISPSLPKLMSMNLDKAIILQLKKKKRGKIIQRRGSKWKCNRYSCGWEQGSVVRKPQGITSHYEFLALHSGVALGPLQQCYPMVHLLRRVGVAVKHPVGRDDHERVGSERRREKEAKPLSSTETLTSEWTKTERLFPGLRVTGRKMAVLLVFSAEAKLAHFCRVYFMPH